MESCKISSPREKYSVVSKAWYKINSSSFVRRKASIASVHSFSSLFELLKLCFALLWEIKYLNEPGKPKVKEVSILEKCVAASRFPPFSSSRAIS